MFSRITFFVDRSKKNDLQNDKMNDFVTCKSGQKQDVNLSLYCPS